MDDDMGPGGLTEEQLVDSDEIEVLVNEAIHAAVGDNVFTHAKVNNWTSNVVEGCLKRLASLSKPFKYVVAANIMQRCGAGVHTAATCWWDAETDGKMCVTYDKNSTMYVVVSVFWVAI